MRARRSIAPTLPDAPAPLWFTTLSSLRDDLVADRTAEGVGSHDVPLCLQALAISGSNAIVGTGVCAPLPPDEDDGGCALGRTGRTGTALAFVVLAALARARRQRLTVRRTR